jgi:hypothetical protein
MGDGSLSGKNMRLTERYRSRVEARLQLEAKVGVLKRTKTLEEDVILVDLSVTGAGVDLPPGRLADHLQLGRSANLSLGDDDAMVSIRQIRTGSGHVFVGVEFVAVSPGFRLQVYEVVNSARDADGAMASYWESAH